MFTETERRSNERRNPTRVSVQKRPDRRNDDRRDAPRLRRMVRLFDQGLSRVERRPAVFSLEGVTWRAPQAELGERYVVQLTLDRPCQVEVEVIRVHAARNGVRVDALFVNPEVGLQLALAREMERVASR